MSLQRTPIPLGQFFSKNVLSIQVYPLVQNPSAIPTGDPFHQVDVSGLSLVFSIFNSSGSTLLATQSTFTTDATQQTLTGSVDCNTAEMASAVTTDPTQVLIEARFTDSSGVSKNIRAEGSSTVIRKQFNSTGSPTPVAGNTYLTDKETAALYLPKSGVASGSFTMLDASNRRWLFYIDTDGTPKTALLS